MAVISVISPAAAAVGVNSLDWRVRYLATFYNPSVRILSVWRRKSDISSEQFFKIKNKLFIDYTCYNLCNFSENKNMILSDDAVHVLNMFFFQGF